MKVTIASQENNMVDLRNMKIQMGHIAKQIAKRQSGQLSANAQTNPREHCSEIASGSGRIPGERDGNNVVVEKEEKNEIEGERDEKEIEKKRSEEKKIKNKERYVLEKRFIIFSCSFKKKNFLFDNLLPKNYFAGNLKQNSTFERF